MSKKNTQKRTLSVAVEHRDSAQRMIDAYRTHYNSILEHSTLANYQRNQAGIDLDLGKNKIETLIDLFQKGWQVDILTYIPQYVMA